MRPNLTKKIQRLSSNLLRKPISIFAILCLMIFSFESIAQTNPNLPTNCTKTGKLTCTANDVKINGAFIAGETATTPINCVSGQSTTAYIYLKVYSQASREGIYFAANLKINGVAQTVVTSFCSPGTIAAAPDNIIRIPTPITFICGSTLALTNTYIAYSQNTNQCSSSPNYCPGAPSKCRDQLQTGDPDIVIETPLAPGLTPVGGDCTGNLREVTFTATASGAVAPYTYRIDYENDGTYDFTTGPTNNTLVTFTHSYTSGQSYTAKLEVTSSGTVQTKTTTAAFLVESCCIPSTAPTGTTKQGDNYCANSGASATIGVTGGSLGTNAVWKWYAGGCGTGTSVGAGTSISVSPTVTTTYYVRAEGGVNGCGNTTCASVTVNVKPVLTVPVATVTRQPTCNSLGTVEITSPDNTVTYTLTKGATVLTAVNGVFSSVASGTYTLSASKTGSCSTNGADVVIDDAPSAPDKPEVGVKTAASCSSSSIVLEVKSPLGDYEYSNNGGAWQTGVEFTIKAGDGFSIKARRTGVNSDCESQAATCPEEVNTTAIAQNRQQAYDVAIELDPKTKVNAAPNPFSDRIRFSVKSSISGQGSLELYNTLGQKVKTVFQGMVTAGQVQTIEYSVPASQRTNLIYLFRVGDQTATGKLIGLRQ